MNSTYSNLIRIIHFSGDLFLINISFLIAYFIKFDHLDILNDDKYLLLLFAYNMAWFIAAYVLKSYDIYRVARYENIISSLFKLFILQSLILMAFWVMIKAFYYSREHIMWTCIFLYPLVSTWRIGLIFSLNQYRKKGFNFRRIIIVGSGEIAFDLKQVIERNTQFGYKIIGVFSDEKIIDKDYIGPVDRIEEFSYKNNIDEIYCSISDLKTNQVSYLTEFSDNNLIRLKLLPDVRGFSNRKLKIDFYEHVPVLIFRNIPLDDIANRFLKRLFDFLFSLIVILLVLSWLFPIIAILIKLNSKGPVLFKQVRSGKNNADFKCWKFRTMYVNTGADSKQASKSDARITSLGAFLRKTSIDEMPQFFNVFYGHMTVVGPRPHMTKHTEEYAGIVNKYMFRHFVKPGITGLAQVKGLRGETKSSLAMEHRIRLDMLYIENWSLILDLKIIVLTILNVFKGDDKAY